MKKLQTGVIATVLLVAVLGLVGGVAGLRVVADGLSRYRTSRTLYRAEIEWRHGNPVEAGRYFVSGLWMIVDGGMRWQAAQVYLLRTDQLVRESKLREARKVCYTADDLLGQYDNAWMMDYRCSLIGYQPPP
ncbi:MAG: hypothetical protein HYZ49_06930 [Chloroflexi bacterium]|nr:hypothetical protein [Chloroflexota bacterium]